MRPLIEYYESAVYAVQRQVKYVDWVRVGKLLLVVPVALVWTPFFFMLENLYKGASWFNNTGGDYIERFLND